jgi:glycosyltransferase involved in cell wall biosynthesis
MHPELTFNSYKSGLKAQVYAALGRPTVASDFSFYADVIRHGETGFLAGSAQEWTDALMELYRDPHTATVMGMNARELESTRTMSKVVHRWEDAYREALP